jgi:hypothetical protein
LASSLVDLLEAQEPEEDTSSSTTATSYTSSSSWWSSSARDVAAGLLKLLLHMVVASGADSSSSVCDGVLLLLQRVVGLSPGVLTGQLPLLGVLLMGVAGTQVCEGKGKWWRERERGWKDDQWIQSFLAR